MAYSLLELGDGKISLEFEKTDIPAVATAIREMFGEVCEIKGVLTNDLKFGGADFICYFEWDPCIISRCEIGSNCLARLLSHLSETASPT